MQILSPKEGGEYDKDTVIPLIFDVGPQDRTTVVYQLDSNKPSSFASSLTLTMDSLSPGSHSISVILLFDDGYVPLTKMTTSHFTIGRLIKILPSTEASTNAWYSVYPNHLWVRNIVYSTVNKMGLEAAASVFVAEQEGVKRLGEGYSFTTLSTKTGACPDKYILYRTPIHGLNNQKIDIMSAIAIANQVGRTLVLPHLFADLMQTQNEVLTFGQVFDAEHLAKSLSEFVCFTTFDEIEKFKDYADEKVEILWHGNLQNLDFYDNLFSGTSNKYVMLDRPQQEMAQFPMNMMYLPEMAAEIRGALRASPKIRDLADSIIAQFSGDFMAFHLRIEGDWKAHCQMRERAHFGELRMCYDVKHVAGQLDRFLQSGTGNGIKNVYIAVGDDIEGSELAPLYSLEGKHGVKFWRKGGMGEGLSHIKLAALDFEICTRGSVFVGSSFSSFAQEGEIGRGEKAARYARCLILLFVTNETLCLSLRSSPNPFRVLLRLLQPRNK